MSGFLQDLRLGAWTLWKSRGFALVAIVTLALGIGANTAVYSLTDQILLRLLPVRDPSALVVLRMPGPKSGHTWADVDQGAQSFSYPFYKDLRADNAVFEGLLARFEIPLSVSGQGQTERATGELVSGNYFDVLGVRPVLGRLLAPDDELRPGGNAVAVLSHGYWTRRFGASPAILNQSLVINGHALTVVGVAAAAFDGVQIGQASDLFLPITLKAQMTPNWNGLDDRLDAWLQMIGRLKPGMSIEQAQAGLQPIVRSLLEQDLARMTGVSAEKRERFLSKKMLLLPGAHGRQVLQQDTRDGLLILSGLVGLVLLIACANVANLQIARGIARRKDIAVRLALGARRAHLVRQLLAETLLLALAGGAAGLLVASWAVDSILALLPRESTAGLTSSIDVRLLAFNFGVAVLTGLVSGLLPALRASRSDLVTALKEQGAGGGTGAGHVRLRRGLVVAQMSVATIVLVTSGLFALSLRQLRGVDVGMRVDGLLAFTIEPELNGYTPDRTIALFDRLRQDLASLPGVVSTTAAEIPVLADSDTGSNVTIEGFTQEGEDGIHVSKNWIGPRYFATLGVPLLAGREIAESDAAAGPKVALINETMARRYFAGRNPIGLHFCFGSGNKLHPDIAIVGIVKDSKAITLKHEDLPFAYIPYAQNPAIGEATFYLRSTQRPDSLAGAVRELVRQADATLPIYGVKTLNEQRDELLYGERLLTTLSLAFALLAALLASIGLYGMMAYTVARRTPEFGIRMALGASLGNVRALVLREALALTAVALLIGLPCAFAAGHLARSLLFGVTPADPLTFLLTALALPAAAALASFVPARRATRVDPMIALRCE
jgi:putative ABC transport system permease protein